MSPTSAKGMMTYLPGLSAPRGDTSAPHRPLGSARSVASKASALSSVATIASPRDGSWSSTRQRPNKRPQPEDAPALSTLDQLMLDVREARGQILASLGRMNHTEVLFAQEYKDISAWVRRIRLEHEEIAVAYLHFFNFSAVQLQRVFRGHRARQLYRQALALKAALRIQRAFRAMRARRAERRKRFRLMSRKVLRGLRGVRARHELSHHELLNRVGHNMMIERQWRMAMGLADTESDLLNALYRRKFVRKRLAATIRNVRIMQGILRYWQDCVRTTKASIPLVMPTVPLSDDNIRNDHVDDTFALDLHNIVVTTPPADGPTFDVGLTSRSLKGKATKPPSGKSPGKRVSSREELRQKQRVYTQRIYEENVKREATRLALLEKQREAARLAEEERKQRDEEQRQLRLLQAQALRDDLERRGLLAIRELQTKKEEEIRKEEQATMRVKAAKQRIAQEVLSDETNLLLTKKTPKKPQ